VVSNAIFRLIDFGRAVSRILSSSPEGEGENHLSKQPVPETHSASGMWSGPLRGFLFGLAPDGVFRALLIAQQAVGFYSTFSPLPNSPKRAGRSIFCGTVRQNALKHFARVYPKPFDPGYAASCPMVFGLSSFSLRRKRFSALPKSRVLYGQKER
jgi:hypothetical protein